MPGKFRLVSVLVLATLIVAAGCSIWAYETKAATAKLSLRAKHQDLLCVDIGTIIVDGTPHQLPATLTISSGEHTVIFPAPPGCEFVIWEDEGELEIEYRTKPSTRILLGTNGGILTVVYKGKCCVQPVGGVVASANTYMALAPYLAVIGLVATVAVAIKKRRN